MQRTRTQQWEHPDGAAATVQALATALFGFTDRLVEENVAIYSSNDFYRNIDQAQLLKHVDLLMAVVELDPRGGYMKQSNMRDAIQANVVAADKVSKLEAALQGSGYSYQDALAMTAYKVRVMLSHAREKYDVLKQDPPEELKGLFHLMSATDKQAPSCKRSRKLDRLGKPRPHPFPYYREPEEEEKDEATADDADNNLVISKYWDGKQALLLKADGTLTVADEYRKGPLGMVEAYWLQESTSLELELPNEFCENGQLKKMTPPVPKVPAKTPMKTKKKKKEKSSVKEKPKDEAPAMRLRGGHGGSMTIMLTGISEKDKVQLIQVTNKQVAGTNFTPRAACQSIMEKLLEKVTEKVTVPVKDCQQLGELREEANVLRKELLS